MTTKEANAQVKRTASTAKGSSVPKHAVIALLSAVVVGILRNKNTAVLESTTEVKAPPLKPPPLLWNGTEATHDLIDLELPIGTTENEMGLIAEWQEMLLQPKWDKHVHRFLSGDILVRMDQDHRTTEARRRAEIGCTLIESALDAQSRIIGSENVETQVPLQMAILCAKQRAYFEAAQAMRRERSVGRKLSIQRVSKLSVREWRRNFVARGLPVIVTMPAEESERWTISKISMACPNATAKLRLSTEAIKTIGNDERENHSLVDYLKELEAGDLDGTQAYLFDWSIPRGCPALLEGWHVPKYVAHDLVQALPVEVSMTTSWPSLLVGPRASGSRLHIDSFSTHFWMHLHEGTKKWRVYSKTELPALYPNAFTESMGIKDSFEPNPDFELFKLASYWEFELSAGELLLIPHDFPHQLVNLETTVAVAGNFLDSANWVAMMKQVRKAQIFTEGDGIGGSHLIEPHVDRILQYTDQQWPPSERFGALNEKEMPWTEFKSQFNELLSLR